MLSVGPEQGPDGQLQLHATTVSIDRKGLVIAGPSGTGKSSLAMKLMALGADLVADDITWITLEKDHPTAICPPALAGLIEVRGMGILNARATGPATVHLLVDLGQTEDQRVPPHREVEVFGRTVPLLHKVETPYFAESILHYVRYGRSDAPQ